MPSVWPPQIVISPSAPNSTRSESPTIQMEWSFEGLKPFDGFHDPWSIRGFVHSMSIVKVCREAALTRRVALDCDTPRPSRVQQYSPRHAERGPTAPRVVVAAGADSDAAAGKNAAGLRHCNIQPVFVIECAVNNGRIRRNTSNRRNPPAHSSPRLALSRSGYFDSACSHSLILGTIQRFEAYSCAVHNVGKKALL